MIEERDSRHSDLRAEMQLGFARVDARFGELREAMRADSAELRQEMHIGFGHIRQEVSQSKADLMKWSFVFWVGAVAAIAALAQVLR